MTKSERQLPDIRRIYNDSYLLEPALKNIKSVNGRYVDDPKEEFERFVNKLSSEPSTTYHTTRRKHLQASNKRRTPAAEYAITQLPNGSIRESPEPTYSEATSKAARHPQGEIRSNASTQGISK